MSSLKLCLPDSITPEQFLSDYWQKKPLLIRQGLPQLIAMFEPDDILNLALYRYWLITSRAYVLATLFLLVHIVGAHYLYSYVPYDEWTQQLFNIKLSTLFGWQRNMYDRLVHFSYGLLLFSAMYQSLQHLLKIPSPKQLIVITLMLNMSTSLLYELFEWGIATTLSPDAAEAYNGQQGDVWDAHKDMALALAGGIIAAIFYAKRLRVNAINKYP